mgnify:CR=1 FL=1
MIYSGKAITVQASDDGIAELCFDLQDESVNKFNALTLNELRDATAAIAADKTLKGVIVTSGKPVFIVGMPRSGTSLVEQIFAAIENCGNIVAKRLELDLDVQCNNAFVFNNYNAFSSPVSH